MIRITKGDIKVEAPNDSFLALQDTSDGLYLKFKDETEIRFIMPVTAQIKAIPQMIMRATSENINVDLDAENIISFS